jgi:ABC-type branched-subunit amino acid transport system substrate-binding protein
MAAWMCEGKAKGSPHDPEQVFGKLCEVCGATEEEEHGKNRGSPRKPLKILMPLIAVGAIALLGGGGYFLSSQTQDPEDPPLAEPTPTPTSTSGSQPVPPNPVLVSESAQSADRISQGERILTLTNNPAKQAGVQAFAAQNWDEAIAEFDRARVSDPNDPESKIYYNNAQARKAGTPMTVAVVVPITPAVTTAQEILRGIAQYQDEYNRDPVYPSQLMEVAIVDAVSASAVPALADDLIQAPAVLGVLGHGLDASSQLAIQKYEQAGLPVLSPMTTEVTATGSDRKSTLRMLTLAQAGTSISAAYITGMGKSLAEYVARREPRSPTVVFFNSDSPYSIQVKDSYKTAINQQGGTIVRIPQGGQPQLEEAVDVARPGFNPVASLAYAREQGARAILLALSAEQLPLAIAIAQANAASPEPLLLIGGDELYGPQLLLKGDQAISGMVLAVPWISKPGDNFAEEASDVWKGRVNWRTSATYDATRGLVGALKLSPNRQEALQKLVDPTGIELLDAASRIDTFDRTPLVQAVPATDDRKGLGRPEGSNFQFDPLL